MRYLFFVLMVALVAPACNKPDTTPATPDDPATTKVTGELLRIDSTFAPGIGFSSPDAFPNVLGVYPGPNGKVYVAAAENSTYQGVEVSPVCRLNADGSLDASFSTRNSFVNGGGRVYDLKTLADGRIAVVGTFRVADAQGSYNIAVLNADGSLDASFVRNGPGAAGPGLFAVAEDGSGRLIAAGSFTTVDGAPAASNLVTFRRSGVLDSTYTWPDVNGRINSLLQTDGGLWIGGEFTKVANQSSTHVAILNATTGALQQPVTLLQNVGLSEGGVRKLVAAPGSKVYAMGAFSYQSGSQSVRNLVRFTSSGQQDADFRYTNTLASVANNRILCGAVTASGNLVVGGDFPYDAAGNNIGMVKSDGSYDKRMTTVNGGTGVGSAFVNGLYIDAQKRIYLAGFFNTLEKKAAPGIVRLVGGD